MIPIGILGALARYRNAGGGGTDPYFSNVVLLCHCDISPFVDSSSYARALTTGSAILETGQVKFGAGSANTAGSPILAATASELVMGTVDFTAELWLYQAPVSTAAALIGQENGTATPGRWIMCTGFSDGSILQVSVDGSTYITSASGVLVANTWQHVAYARGAGTGRLFVGGNIVATLADANDYSAPIAVPLGGGGSGLSNVLGYTDDYRLTKGICRYTTNFTPPTAAFPNS